MVPQAPVTDSSGVRARWNISACRLQSGEAQQLLPLFQAGSAPCGPATAYQTCSQSHTACLTTHFYCLIAVLHLLPAVGREVSLWSFFSSSTLAGLAWCADLTVTHLVPLAVALLASRKQRLYDHLGSGMKWANS